MSSLARRDLDVCGDCRGFATASTVMESPHALPAVAVAAATASPRIAPAAVAAPTSSELSEQEASILRVIAMANGQPLPPQAVTEEDQIVQRIAAMANGEALPTVDPASQDAEENAAIARILRFDEEEMAGRRAARAVAP